MLTSVGRWTIQHDVDATTKFYAELSRADYGFTCECDSCKNIAAVLDRAFPRSFVSIADDMGIDTSKYVMLDHYSPDDSGLYTTHGEFFLPGKITGGGDVWKDSRHGKRAGWEKLEDDFQLGFTAVVSSPDVHYDPVTFIALKFQTGVPWVLDAPKPSWEPM